MAGGGGNQTTRTEPPRYQLPYLERGLGYAQDQYSRTASGQNIAPMSSETERALSQIAGRADSGSLANANAQNYATRSLTGGFLGSNPYMNQLQQFSNPGQNPHLDNTFNQAALATQNQLASQFAGRGRNVDASEGLRAQQLGDLATNIYGGAYENDRNRALQATGMQAGLYGDERNRQQQVLGMVPGLQQSSYADLDRLLGVGQTREGYAQQQLDAPGAALDSYLNRVSGNMGQTTITPTSQNRGAGALGGALGGAQIGSIFGPWGSVLGGIGGGLLGGWG